LIRSTVKPLVSGTCQARVKDGRRYAASTALPPDASSLSRPMTSPPYAVQISLSIGSAPRLTVRPLVVSTRKPSPASASNSTTPSGAAAIASKSTPSTPGRAAAALPSGHLRTASIRCSSITSESSPPGRFHRSLPVLRSTRSTALAVNASSSSTIASVPT
jgi:hypothetical protein